MLGRLARYLRFLGYDAEYARGVTDTQLLRRAREEDRRVLTRDKGLAERSPRATLIYSVEVEEQLREVRAAFPSLRTEVRFLRCSVCNQLLRQADRSTPNPPRGVPDAVWGGAEPVYTCPGCGQSFWEGSHTAEIRRTLARVFSSASPPLPSPSTAAGRGPP